MQRVNNWPSKLEAAVETATQKKFEYGKHDCVLMACDIVKSITGVDLAKDVRGRYSNLQEGIVLLKEFGGSMDALNEFIAKHQNLPEIPISKAQRGDTVLFDSDEGPSLGVCLGAKSIFPNMKMNVIMIPTHACRRAWKIAR